MNHLVPITSGMEEYRQSTDAASLCREIVLKTATNIQGRQYVNVEGWQAIAIAHGCAAGSRGVEKVEGGVRAIGEIRRMSDGQVIAIAEGFVGEDEPTWYGGTVTNKWGSKTLPKRADYAIRAMAQTRAISRACRSAFAHVVVMIDAGLSTTPAEEVPEGGFVEVQSQEVPQQRPSEPANKSQPNDRVNEEQLTKINMLLKATKIDEVTFCEMMRAPKGARVFQLPQHRFAAAVEMLEAKLADLAKGETNKAAANSGLGEILEDSIPY